MNIQDELMKLLDKAKQGSTKPEAPQEETEAASFRNIVDQIAR
jgi:hypothetical protein